MPATRQAAGIQIKGGECALPKCIECAGYGRSPVGWKARFKPCSLVYTLQILYTHLHSIVHAPLSLRVSGHSRCAQASGSAQGALCTVVGRVPFACSGMYFIKVPRLCVGRTATGPAESAPSITSTHARTRHGSAFRCGGGLGASEARTTTSRDHVAAVKGNGSRIEGTIL